ncbi:MAG TPA: DUF2249 domain-containing protein [Edaphocola sp.]|nr:DUF2249 domain-containing protein [Edaphocola sp.]
MLINKDTKIAALLKHNPESLEAIISLSKDFNKLRNPLLRKLMAGRTSIGMAAVIGGCSSEDFFNVLAPLGFETDAAQTSKAPVEESETKKPLPDYLKHIDSEKIIPFDVRALLAGGEDPLRAIQEKVKDLNPGEVLKIVNTFEPTPLIKLLEKQGFQTHVDIIEPQLIETYFYKTDNSGGATLANETASADGDWEAMLQKYQGNRVEIDVRHLEMPMPMMTILENLETLPDGKALFVNHKRIPVFLLTELKDRNFEYRIKEVQEGEVYLLIFKNN